MIRKIPPLVEEIIAVSQKKKKKESNIEIVRGSVTGTLVSLALVQLPVQPYMQLEFNFIRVKRCYIFVMFATLLLL